MPFAHRRGAEGAKKNTFKFCFERPTAAALISKPRITGLIKYLCGLCVFAARLYFNRSADFLQMLAKGIG